MNGFVSSTTCLVCGEAAKPALVYTDRDVSLCNDPGCRLAANQRHTLSPKAFAQYLAHQRGVLHARRKASKALALVVAQKTQREAEENEAVWAAAEAQLAGQLPHNSERLVLPSGPRRLRNLPQRERNRYRDHLNRIIAQATSGVDLSHEPQVAPVDTASKTSADLLTNVCTLCRGGCCTSGGHKAYLTAATIRRFMAARPGLRPREVLAAYLAHLPPRTEAGSCVNHGALGCSLPRDLRSDVCNRYLCDTAKSIGEREAVVALVRRQDVWNRYTPERDNNIVGVALVTQNGITLYDK